VLCDRDGKSALHMVAQYSENREVLQNVLQIDHSLTKKKVANMALLCGRSEFLSFQKMLLCLIEVDSTVSVIRDGVFHCMRQFKGSSYQYFTWIKR
jgi:hypothetical protein